MCVCLLLVLDGGVGCLEHGVQWSVSPESERWQLWELSPGSCSLLAAAWAASACHTLGLSGKTCTGQQEDLGISVSALCSHHVSSMDHGPHVGPSVVHVESCGGAEEHRKGAQSSRGIPTPLYFGEARGIQGLSRSW